MEFIIMTLISLLLFIFVYWRGIRTLPCPWYVKGGLTGLAGVIAFKFKVIRILGGSYFAPNLPGWFIIFMAWLFAVLFIWGIMLIPIDLVLFFQTFSKALRCGLQGKKTKWSCFFRKNPLLDKIHAYALCLAVIFASIGACYGLGMPRIRHVTVASARVPREADGMKITLLADLHVDRYNDQKRIRRIVEKANTLDPDIVCIAGDFADGTRKQHKAALKELGKLRSVSGIFGVPGNHEYYCGYKKVIACLKEAGVQMLLNENRFLEKYNVRICGITDKQALRYKEQMPDIPKALSGKKEEFKIFLSHRPDTARQAAALGAALQLSGHTHGGMVWGFDLLVGALNGGCAWGEHDINGMTLVISNGTCIWSSFPIRLGRPGEIILITLKKI